MLDLDGLMSIFDLKNVCAIEKDCCINVSL